MHMDINKNDKDIKKKSITQQEWWNEIYKKAGKNPPAVDNWLDKYFDIIKSHCHTNIIDLGCGFGNDSLYLSKKGYCVLSCDYSEAALSRLKHFIDNPIIKSLDMRKPLPFQSESTEIIICDLSIHYFDSITTKSIIKELYRILKNEGIILCRVNAVEEMANEQNPAKYIEENFYQVGAKTKRYFTKEDINRFFSDFYIDEIKSYIMIRYNDPKHVLEFIAQKRSSE